MISVRGLVKRFEARDFARNVVNGLEFEIPEGKLFTLLGPSGCGKTTTLRMIAGLERPTEGEIELDDRLVFSDKKHIFVPANKRSIGMVFQSYAIWPHMTVFQNVAFPLTVGGGMRDRKRVNEKTMAALDLVGLADTAQRSATTLSGGQQQRVALARALVREPRVLLLDEPLSNLDAQLRERMRGEIREVQQKLGITAVYVTHDQSEALAISDLVMVMDQGNIVEMGTPTAIYSNPRSEFTANFIGVANGFSGSVQAREDDVLVVSTAQGLLRCPVTDGILAGDSVRVFLRPENFTLSRTRHSDHAWAGTVRFSIYQGDSWDYHIDVNGQELRVRARQEKQGLSRGDQVHLEADTTAAVVMKG